MRRFMLATALLALPFASQAYSFKVTNNTESKITGIQATEDGKNWGAFDVGKGIEPGATYEMTWDPSTDESGCEWQVKASYADGSESEPATFDFCEEDLELDFSE